MIRKKVTIKKRNTDHGETEKYNFEDEEKE